MHCPDDLELALWVDGALPGQLAQQLAGHLEECLECRLAAGTGTGALGLLPGSFEDAPRLQSYEETLPMLRRAFATEVSEKLEQHCGPAAEETSTPLLMAADSSLRSRTATIPSVLGEEGKLVVTFRVDPETSAATAHFVSRDPVRTRFRALQVGDEVRISDSSGRVDLTGFSPDELLGMRALVPPSLYEGEFEMPSDAGAAWRTAIALLDRDGRPAVLRAEARLLSDPTGNVISIAILASAPPRLGAVLIGDEARAHFVRMDDSNTAAFAWGSDLPRQVRVTILDLA